MYLARQRNAIFLFTQTQCNEQAFLCNETGILLTLALELHPVVVRKCNYILTYIKEVSAQQYLLL
jgi:hypothetical protein